MAPRNAIRTSLHGESHGGVMDTATSRYGSFYNEKVAEADLHSFRKKGPRPWTGTLIEALKAEGLEGATLLDIGGGIGAIQHGLLAAGVASVTSVDASAPYLKAAQNESDSRGYAGRVRYLHGDFVQLAESVPPADIVTLDRVINVYPDFEQLVRLSAERALRLYGFVLPRETRTVRVVIRAMNLVLSLLRKPVRAIVHPVDSIDCILRENGLSPHFSQTVGSVWQVLVYRRL